MTNSYFKALSSSKYIQELVIQKKIAIEELSGGGCEIQNFVMRSSPHIENLILDFSVENPLVINFGNDYNYKVDIESTFGLSYSASDFTEKASRLAELIALVYEGAAEINEKKGIFANVYIKTPTGKYKAKKEATH